MAMKSHFTPASILRYLKQRMLTLSWNQKNYFSISVVPYNGFVGSEFYYPFNINNPQFPPTAMIGMSRALQRGNQMPKVEFVALCRHVDGKMKATPQTSVGNSLQCGHQRSEEASVNVRSHVPSSVMVQTGINASAETPLVFVEESNWTFQPDWSPTHETKTIVELCRQEIPDVWGNDIWPSNSLDLKLKDEVSEDELRTTVGNVRTHLRLCIQWWKNPRTLNEVNDVLYTNPRGAAPHWGSIYVDESKQIEGSFIQNGLIMNLTHQNMAGASIRLLQYVGSPESNNFRFMWVLARDVDITTVLSQKQSGICSPRMAPAVFQAHFLSSVYILTKQRCACSCPAPNLKL
uniref:START domain-containing protein n=1 Tax=Heterorhabditis bacteriophora TaxID=37862 RepID=A0A1I7WFR7_HETBA